MDRESFIESVKSQYVDEIKEAFLECEHHGGNEVDYSQLSDRLKSLMTGAKKAGIPPKDFLLLIHVILPHVVDKLSLSEAKKAA